MRELKVIGPGNRVAEAASGAMRREGAISNRLVGAEGVWFGYVELPVCAASAMHHHGESESGIYIISGAARFYAGNDLSEVHEAREGDFVWVPPHLPHVEMNASKNEPVRMAVVRSTQEAIVVNLPFPDGWEPPELSPR